MAFTFRDLLVAVAVLEANSKPPVRCCRCGKVCYYAGEEPPHTAVPCDDCRAETTRPARSRIDDTYE